jgi:hypothetical protein
VLGSWDFKFKAVKMLFIAQVKINILGVKEDGKFADHLWSQMESELDRVGWNGNSAGISEH